MGGKNIDDLKSQVINKNEIINRLDGTIGDIDKRIERLKIVQESLGRYQSDIEDRKKNCHNLTEEIGSNKEWEGLGKLLVTFSFGKVCEDWDSINSKRQECYDLIRRKVVELQGEKAFYQGQINDANNAIMECNREITKLKRES